MTVKESRFRKGTITLGTTPDTISVECQITSAVFDSDFNEDKEDPVEVLCGDILESEGTRSLAWTFNLAAVQDFDDPLGLIRWSHENALTDQPISVKFNDTGTTVTSTVTVVPLPVGGEVNKRLIAEKEWPCTAPIWPATP